MIDQKDAMQLIGEWGYTPKSFEKFLHERRSTARDIGEKAGMTVYSSLLSLCRFAASGDASYSVIDEGDDLPKELHDELNKQIKDMVDDEPEFAGAVVDKVYDTCSPYKDYHEAELALRREVISSVSPLVIMSIVEVGSRTSEQVLKSLISIDAIRSDRDDDAWNKLSKPVAVMKQFAQHVMRYSDEIEACSKTDNSEFNEMVGHVVGSIERLHEIASQNLLSIIDNSPHEWVEYAADFGRLMCGFALALSFGYISYDDYQRIIEIFQHLHQKEDKPIGVFYWRN